MEVGEANGSEIHELNQKMNFLKKEKRAAQNKIVELTVCIGVYFSFINPKCKYTIDPLYHGISYNE